MTTIEKTETTDRLALAVTGLEPASAVVLRAAFEEMFAQAERWTQSAKLIRVTDVSQKREMKFARESRLALREIRVNAEKARKRLKEDSVRQGKAIDGIANVLKALIEPLEEHLLEQETFAERAEEAERSALRDARAETLRALGADPTLYMDLGAQAEESWTAILESARAVNEAKLEAQRQAEQVRIEAEKIAAEKREAARLEAVRVEAERVAREQAQLEENARLKAEAQERELAAKAERERVEKEKAEIRAQAEAQARAAADAERQRVDKEQAAEREKHAAEVEARNAAFREERAKADREAAAVRAESERVAAELAATKAAAELQAKAERDREAARVAAEEQAALAPDREKLLAFAAMMRGLKTPATATPKSMKVRAALETKITALATWLEAEAAGL